MTTQSIGFMMLGAVVIAMVCFAAGAGFGFMLATTGG